MVDTPRTTAQLQALFADNSTGNISPQDLRDFVVTTDLGVFNVKAYGAVGDGVTDDTAAIQAAVDNSFGFSPDGGIGSATLLCPPGNYKISDTILFNRVSGSFMGTGNQTSPAYNQGLGTVFAWAGNNTSPMFKVTDSRAFTIGNLRLQGEDTNPPTYGIEFNNPGGATRGSNEYLMVRDVVIGAFPWVYPYTGAYTGAVQNGIGFTGDDGNNDQMFIERCHIRATNYGIELANPQSTWGKITDVVFDQCAVGMYANARVVLVNPGFSACTKDIYTNYACTVYHINSEGSGQLAEVGNDGSLKIRDGKVSCTTIETGGGVLIDAWPSDRQTIILDAVDFSDMTIPTSCTIDIGPGDGGTPVGRIYLKVEGCNRLTPGNINLLGSFWAYVPESQMTIEWWSRNVDDIHQFRNILSTTGRTTIDTGVWEGVSI